MDHWGEAAGAAAELSIGARSVWAKSIPDPEHPALVGSWLPLYQHLADTAAVAGRLWDRWLPPAVRSCIEAGTGLDAARARALAVWLAGTHDVGKASPAFAVQVAALCDAMTAAGLRSDPMLAGSMERRGVRHEVVSFLAVSEWLTDAHGVGAELAQSIASVAAAHHGMPPDDNAVVSAGHQDRLVGDAPWHRVRVELIEWVTAMTVTQDDIEAWRGATIGQPALVLLSAIVIVADWIASSDAVPLVPVGRHPDTSGDQRAERAWADLGLPGPWDPSPPADDDALFAARFRLPGGARPRSVQTALMAAARTVDAPSLHILEAPMGVGKTEAALAAAEILAARFGLGGIFVALPTQATADGMFARVMGWAARLGLEVPTSVFLAHGRSATNEDYQRLRHAAWVRAIGEEYRLGRESAEDLATVHRWFADPKRGPLANLVIGTIDQALHAGLRSKHLMLRHLALAGKVVIIDEVHAYDAYMGQYLRRVLHWLGAYRTPVILLSATLPAATRRELVEAYEGGRRIGPSGRAPSAGRAERRAVQERYTVLDGDIGYPSIVTSGTGEQSPTVVLPGGAGSRRTLRVERMDDDLDSLVELLRDRLRSGGTVAIIRNTVTRVQATAAALRSAFPDDEVIVAHSRFLAVDRAARDRLLLGRFGPAGERPVRGIVVASQVIEQSLDLDFDLMVSDLAPVDLLLQRAGRLHRHARDGRPAPVAEPVLVVTGVDWGASPPDSVRGSRIVYAPAILLRTLAALQDRDAIVLPDDIPELVQRVYAVAPFGPDAWRGRMLDADARMAQRRADQIDAARSFLLGEVRRGMMSSLIGWVSGGAGDPANDAMAEASVRDTDPSLEVIVLQRGDGIISTPSWIPDHGGRQIPDLGDPDPALTRAILGCALRLPAAMCRGAMLDRHIAELEDWRVRELPQWAGSRLLRAELVLILDSDGVGRLGEYDVRYTARDGLAYTLHAGGESSVG